MDAKLRRYGEAPFRVAVLHGGPGAGGEMAAVARRVSKLCGVLEPVQTAASVWGQVDELRETLATEAALPCGLVGYSWGAWLAVLAAARYPAIVRKLVLVSTPPLAERYVPALAAARMSRLSEEERAEFQATAAALDKTGAPERDKLLARLGSLAAKADQFDPLPRAPDDQAVTLSGEIFRTVWSEAALMRRMGELVRYAREVRCPIAAIHGDYDPSPAAGVTEPLTAAGIALQFVLLANCGHTPWLERRAQEEFYRVLLSELQSSGDPPFGTESPRRPVR